MVRNHVIARKTSCRPAAEAIKDVPIKLGDLQTHKITMRDGAATMMVDSVASAERQICSNAFFGKTLFPPNKEAALKLKMPYINPKKKIHKSNSNFTENSPSEVWMAATRPLKKKKDNEADLKEFRMTVEDRLTFMTAKKAKLQSISDNGIWQLETERGKTSTSRALKARFVRKWADDGKGGTKEKSRLVFAGIFRPRLAIRQSRDKLTNLQ